MLGKRMFISLTGTEISEALPINQGQPMQGQMYILAGKVTEEHTQGIWFSLEKLYRDGNGLHIDPPRVDVYFLRWSVLKRVTLIQEPAPKPLPPPSTGLYL